MFKVPFSAVLTNGNFCSDKYVYAGNEFVQIFIPDAVLSFEYKNSFFAVSKLNGAVYTFELYEMVEVDKVDFTSVVQMAKKVLMESYGKKDGIVRTHQLRYCELEIKTVEQFNNYVGLLVDDTISPAYPDN